MAKEDTRSRTARDKAAEMRAAEQRRARRNRLLLAGGAVVVVLAVIAVLVIAKAAGGDTSTPTASGSATPAAAAGEGIVKDISSVPASTFDAVGAGTAAAFPTKANPPGTQSSPPRVLYYGAEFCPFCAAERWPVAVALARFGTWHDLGVTTSSASDQFPNTPTLSFHGATLSSSSVDFQGYETTTNQPNAAGNGYQPLDTPSAADQQILRALNPGGSIPFVSFDQQYVQSGASYSPDLLAGKTQAEIAAALADPQSPIAQAIVGSANVVTAAICATTNQQPAAVCSSSGVKAGAAKLGS